MFDNELLVNNIKILCRNNNTNISSLEKELGFGAGVISRWGKADPSLSKIIRIADFFHVSLDELVGYQRSYREHLELKLIDSLYESTQRGELTWNICDEDNSLMFRTPIFTKDELKLYEGWNKECYFAKYEEGYFFIKCIFLSINHSITDIQIYLYVKPDVESDIELYSEDYQWLDPLWKFVRFPFYGTLNEVKSDDFVELFLKDSEIKRVTNSFLDLKKKVSTLRNDNIRIAYSNVLDEQFEKFQESIENSLNEKFSKAHNLDKHKKDLEN